MTYSLGRDRTNKDIHTCPSINKSFYGDCPAVSCPLNITKKTTGKGGCFLFLKQPSLLEAAYQLGITSGTADRRYGVAIQASLLLHKILKYLRKFTPETDICEKCGKSGCKSNYGCGRRQRYLEFLIKGTPLENKFISLNKNVLWQAALAPATRELNIFNEGLLDKALDFYSL